MAMLSNGDTIKTALNAPRMARKCRADKLTLRRKGGQNERKRDDGEEGRVPENGM